MSHYESESQTLTASAEANLLKNKELVQQQTEEDMVRWQEIKSIFAKNNRLKSIGNNNEMVQIISQMELFTENLEGIKAVLQKKFE